MSDPDDRLALTTPIHHQSHHRLDGDAGDVLMWLECADGCYVLTCCLASAMLTVVGLRGEAVAGFENQGIAGWQAGCPQCRNEG